MTDFVTLPLLNPRGAYDPTVVYNPNDLITYNGVPYYCRVGTIVGQPITPGSDTNTWQLLSVPGNPGDKGDKGDPGIQGPLGRTGQSGADGSGYRLRGQWDAATAYSANDSVSYIDAIGHYTVIWFAIKDNTNVPPGSDNTVWGAGIKGDTGDVTPEAQAAAAAALASQGAAAASEADALAYKNAAGTSATNASESEANALAYKNAAGTSEQNAATSEANALTYKNAAGTSALAAAASAATAATGSPNLVFNGSGEVGVLGWSGGPTAISASRDGDGPYLLFAANGASSTSAFVSQAFPVKGGLAHTVQADILADAAATGTYAVDVNYYASADGSGAVLFDGGNANLAAKDGAWHRTSGTDAAANVPAGANSARVRLVVTAATWTTLKLRRVKVEQSVNASLYSQETTLSAFGPNPAANLSPIFQAVQANGTIKSTSGGFVFPDGSTQGVAIGRNRIINGDCRIAQRGPLVVTAGISGYGGPDRFACAAAAAAGGQFTQSQSTIVYGGVTRNAVLQVCNTAVANLTGTNFWSGIVQNVEGWNCADMLGAAAAISFIFSTNVTGTYSVALRDSTNANSFVSFFNAVANTPVKVSIPVSTLPTNLVTGYVGTLGLSVSVGAMNQGTYNTATVNSWVAGSFVTAAGAANWASAPNNFIALTELQLETGPVATPFERRSVAHEVVLCQRYYQTDVVTVTPARGDFYSPVMLKTVMRANPTVVWYSPTTSAVGFLRDNDNTRDVPVTSTAVLSATQIGPLTGGSPAMAVGANTSIGYRVSAEL